MKWKKRQRELVRFAGALGSLLPDRVWRIIWRTMLENRRLLDRQGWFFMRELAARMNVRRLGVAGDYGLLSSDSTDAYILREYAKIGRWAGPTNALIKSFFAAGEGTYFDIGANIGMTTIPIASTSNVHCFAFEPDPVNFANLKTNITENCKGGNVSINQIALFDRDATLDFELAEYNLGDHRIRIGNSREEIFGERSRKTIAVEARRLDDLKLPITPPFLAKIDTQGAEPFIIGGGRKTLALADMIVMEWSPYLMRRMSADARAAIVFLREAFTKGAINNDPTSDNWIEPEFKSISEICRQLEDSLTTFRGDRYVDLIVSK
jgi:FkbM family methyltransferase